jgi:hypothetical protein
MGTKITSVNNTTYYISSSGHFAHGTFGAILRAFAVLKIESSSAIFPNIPFEHIHRARSRFKNFLDDASRGPATQDRTLLEQKLFCQSLIRKYEECFLRFHQALYAAELRTPSQDIRPVFIAPKKTQMMLLRAFFDRTDLHLDKNYHLLIILSSIQFWVLFFRDIVKAVGASMALPILSSAQYMTKPKIFYAVRGANFWFGHPNLSPQLPERLSEEFFLNDVISAAKLDKKTDEIPNIAMMNFTRHRKPTQFNYLVRNTSLIRTPTPLSIFGYLKLQSQNLHLLAKFLLGQSQVPEFLTDELKTNYCQYFLERLRPRAGFFTNSSYQGDHIQAAMARIGIPVKFIYYSVNNACPQTWLDTKVVETISWRYNVADRHLTWDQNNKKWLEDIVHCRPDKISVVGPIMFAATHPELFRDNRPKKQTSDQFCLGVFDVTPISYSTGFKLGMGPGLYDLDTCKDFLQDVLRTADIVFDRNIIFVFKLKRQPLADFHDNAYLSFQQEMVTHLGDRAIVFDPDWNPWITLDACNAVLGIPYTSMVDAALSTGLPAAYYSPFKTKIRCDYKSPITLHDISSLEAWLNACKNSPRQALNRDVLQSTIRTISKEFY